MVGGRRNEKSKNSDVMMKNVSVVRHLGLIKYNLLVAVHVRTHFASLCQILWRSVITSKRYLDFSRLFKKNFFLLKCKKIAVRPKHNKSH